MSECEARYEATLDEFRNRLECWLKAYNFELDTKLYTKAEWIARKETDIHFHWSSLSASRLRTYKDFVRGGVHHAKCSSLMFQSIVFEKRKINWKLYHGGDGELGFYGLWFQFLMNAFMDWIPDGSRVRIILDERSTSYSLDSLKSRLNNAIRERNGRQRITVVNIEPRDSAMCHFLQMTDLVTGAVSHQHNRHRVDLASKRGAAKEELANYSAGLIGVGSFTQRIRLPFFEVWPYRLQ